MASYERVEVKGVAIPRLIPIIFNICYWVSVSLQLNELGGRKKKLINSDEVYSQRKKKVLRKTWLFSAPGAPPRIVPCPFFTTRYGGISQTSALRPTTMCGKEGAWGTMWR